MHERTDAVVALQGARLSRYPRLGAGHSVRR
jgi:hypothetical protein